MSGVSISKTAKSARVCGMLKDSEVSISGFAAQGVVHVFTCYEITHWDPSVSVVDFYQVSKGARMCGTLDGAGDEIAAATELSNQEVGPATTHLWT
jgi:hypothetical protein